MYPVEVGKVALLKSNNRLVYVLRHPVVGPYFNTDTTRVDVTYEHDGEFRTSTVFLSELETPEARMIEEAKFQKFIFDLTAQVNESAKTQKGPELVQ